MLLSFIVTYSCSNNPVSSTATTHQALTERDFADENLKAGPGPVVVLNLEAHNSPVNPQWFDTETIGVDIIPFRYTETAAHHFSIGDSFAFEVALINDSFSQVMFELDEQNKETDVTIPAGDYYMIFTSLKTYGGSNASGVQTVFIQPDRSVSGSANTDYDTLQLRTLLYGNTCYRCDLSGANLHAVDLTNAELSYANLYMADLSNAILLNASLPFANLRYADLNQANFVNSRLIFADLRNTYLIDANLSNANLNGAHLDTATLVRSNLINVNLWSARLIYANLTNATLNNAALNFADLSYANLHNAHLDSANLQNATLINTNLPNASLIHADLSYANLSGAVFCNAILSGVIAYDVITNGSTLCWPF